MCRLSWNLGAWTSWNPRGLPRPVVGLLYLYFCPHNVAPPMLTPTRLFATLCNVSNIQHRWRTSENTLMFTPSSFLVTYTPVFVLLLFLLHSLLLFCLPFSICHSCSAHLSFYAQLLSLTLTLSFLSPVSTLFFTFLSVCLPYISSTTTKERNWYPLYQCFPTFSTSRYPWPRSSYLTVPLEENYFLKLIYFLITLVNKILAHERFIVFLTYLFTLNPNMQSNFFHHPQFLYNGLFNYWFFGIFGIFISDFFIHEQIF